MGRYLLRRLLIAVPSLLGISVVLFTILALAPGDPFGELASNPAVPPEVRLALRAKFGMDDPIYLRYVNWLTAMLHGDWGFSFVSRVDVDRLILQRLPATLLVIGSSQILALMIALPVGVIAATRPYSIFDQVANTFAFIGFSLPTFFTGLLFILVFSIHLHLLPFVFNSELPFTGWRWYWEEFRQSIMPISVLGMFQGASWTRYVRSAVLDVIRLDYVTTARAKGLREPKVVVKHHHGADLPRARDRLAADHLDPRQRHPRHHGGDIRLRLLGRSLQPHRGRPLWLARPPHRLPLSPRRLKPRRRASRPRSTPGGASGGIAWRWRAP